jgi:hypothetical protein
MDPNEPLLCKCGHDLKMHGPRGCTASNGSQCLCSRSQRAVLALFDSPEPNPISVQPWCEPNADALLNKYWSMQEHHQAARQEQMRILRELRTKAIKQGADD